MNRTTFATSNFRGGRRSASRSIGGRVGRGGQFVTYEQRLADMRAAFGMASG